MRSHEATPSPIPGVFERSLQVDERQIPEPQSPLSDIIERLKSARDLRAPRARKVIEESEKRFASFMNHLPGFAWIKDLEGKYLFVNRCCQVLPAYGKHPDYAGKTDEELWPAEIATEYRANDLEVIRTGRELQRIETLLLNGQRRSVLANKFPIFDAAGKVAFVAGIAFDITNHLQIEQELKESQAQLRALAARLQSVREEEALRIAREIHDELGQALAALNLDCASLEKRFQKLNAPDGPEVRARLEAMGRALEQTLATVQRICAELRPPVLDDLGLVAALECQAAELQARTGIRCVWVAKPELLHLSSTQTIGIFRIFQEILTNVMRHARASELKIELEIDSASLVLEVTDNGKGICERDISNPKSLGVLGMRERALLLGGTLDIRPGPSGGTVVSLKIASDDLRKLCPPEA